MMPDTRKKNFLPAHNFLIIYTIIIYLERDIIKTLKSYIF